MRLFDFSNHVKRGRNLCKALLLGDVAKRFINRVVFLILVVLCAAQELGYLVIDVDRVSAVNLNRLAEQLL